jgi:hypothetical protein
MYACCASVVLDVLSYFDIHTFHKGKFAFLSLLGSKERKVFDEDTLKSVY